MHCPSSIAVTARRWGAAAHCCAVPRLQVQGKVREKVAEAGKALGLDGHYIPRSYIEQVGAFLQRRCSPRRSTGRPSPDGQAPT